LVSRPHHLVPFRNPDALIRHKKAALFGIIRDMTGNDEPGTAADAARLLDQLRVSAYHRKENAAALARLGDQPRAAAHFELMRLMAMGRAEDPARDLRLGGGDEDGAFQRLYTARALGALGPRYAAEAAEALRSVIALYPGWVRVQAARELGALGEPYQREAATVLRQEVGPGKDQYYGGTSVNLDAACAFASWGPAWAEESAAALRRLAGERRCYLQRPKAALALAELDEAYRDEALAFLIDAVSATGLFESKVIPEAARAALSLTPSSAGQITGILRAHLAAPDLGEEERAHIQQALAELG
jgi:hypothetical protein